MPYSSQSYVDRLREVGFFEGMDDARREAVEQHILDGGSLLYDELSLGWWADGEDLADGEVERLLDEMTPALAQLHVALDVSTVTSPFDDDSNGYVVRINGEDLVLYTMEPGSASPDSRDPWMDCTLKPLGRVNDLLAAVESNHRVLVFSPGGNDGYALLVPVEAIPLLIESEGPGSTEEPAVP